jgi:hypothetical protein
MIVDDPNLDDEQKDDLTELIAEVKMNPTVANVEVLSVVLKKLGDYSQYLGALQTINNIKATSSL